MEWEITGDFGRKKPQNLQSLSFNRVRKILMYRC